MMSASMMAAPSSTRPCIRNPATQQPRAGRAFALQPRLSHIALGLKDDLIGQVNDPERTKKQAQKKHEDKDSQWATPKNNNPLEKTTVGHGIGATGEESKGETGDVVGKAKDAVDDAVEGVKDAAKKATGQD